MAEAEKDLVNTMAANELDANEQKYRIMLERGQISETELTRILVEQEKQRASAKIQFLQDQLNQENLSQEKRISIMKEIENAQAESNKKLIDLNNELFKQQHRHLFAFRDATKSAFSQLGQDILLSTKSITELYQNMFNTIINSVVKSFVDSWTTQLTDKLFANALKSKTDLATIKETEQAGLTSIHIAGEQARVLATKTAAVQMGVTGATAATAMVTATEAAFTGILGMISAMAAEIATIMPMGPGLAKSIMAGVGTATTALTAASGTATTGIGTAYSTILAAAGGMDIARDQIIKVHEKEMVLPRRLSDGFRNIINNHNTNNSTSNKSNFSPIIKISTGGGRGTGFREEASKNAKELVRVLGRQWRKFDRQK